MFDKSFLKQVFQDKDGSYNLREVVTVIFTLATLVSWIGQQFFQILVPEYMFYSFISLVGAGCFGYSIERKTKPDPEQANTDENKNELQGK